MARNRAITSMAIVAIIIGLPLRFFMTDFIYKSALGDTYDFNAEIKVISYKYKQCKLQFSEKI